jgi:SAM-dependent methyltransferase
MIVLAEYLSLDPLQVRIDLHRRYSERADDVESSVLSALALKPGAALLDVGFGTGSFLRRLAGGGFAVTGVDTSDAAVSRALQDGLTVKWADAQDLPFADASFDVVTARHMLYHVPDPIRALAEARRVLRPGGVFAGVVNIENAMPALFGIVAAAVAAQGLDPGVFSVPVHSGNLPAMVTSIFGGATVELHQNALVIDSPEPVAAYAVSCLTGFGVPPGHPARPAIVDSIQARATELFAGGGTLRDPKGYVIVTARR